MFMYYRTWKQIVVTGSGSFIVLLIINYLNSHIMETEVFSVENKFKSMNFLMQKESKPTALIQ